MFTEARKKCQNFTITQSLRFPFLNNEIHRLTASDWFSQDYKCFCNKV